MAKIYSEGFQYSYTDIASDYDRLWDYHFERAQTKDEKQAFLKLGKAHVEAAYYDKGAYGPIVRDLQCNAALTSDWRKNKRILKCIERLRVGGERELLKRLVRSAVVNRIRKYWEYHKHRNHHEWGDTHKLAAADEKTLALEDLDFAVRLMNDLGERKEAEHYETEKALLSEDKRNLVRTKPDSRPMDEDVFWEVIDAGRNADTLPDQVQAVTEKLATFGGRNIQKFQRILDQKLSDAYRWDIWALAYLAQGGCSDDAFEYFRAWLVLQGREIYARALDDVKDILDNVPQGSGTQAEMLLYAVDDAYALRTGNTLKPVKSKRPLQPRGKKWNESSIVSDHPEIAAHFGRAYSGKRSARIRSDA